LPCRFATKSRHSTFEITGYHSCCAEAYGRNTPKTLQLSATLQAEGVSDREKGAGRT